MIFCHYNYILNPDIRKRLKLDLTKAIIVFDEAHHIENASE